MKKRLLITSIVMMLVVAVALSTATYAWFTSNANVTATTLTMTAAINEAPALEISYVDTEGTWLTTIVATNDTPTGGFKPAAPETLAIANPTAQTPTAGTYYSALTWKTATVVNGKFNSDVSQVGTNYVWHDAGNAHSSFFLHNASTANQISGITMTATIGGEAASFIRIAVFKKIGVNFELYGIISNGKAYTLATSYVENTDYYTTDGTKLTTINSAQTFAEAGQVYTESAVTSVATGTVAANGELVSSNIATQNICTTSVALGDLGVNDITQGGDDQMELKVVVWMDGAALNDDTAGAGTGEAPNKTGKVSSIALNFAAAR